MSGRPTTKLKSRRNKSQEINGRLQRWKNRASKVSVGSLLLLAITLNAAASEQVVGKIEFVQEIPLMDLSAKAKILYGGLEQKDVRAPLRSRAGAQRSINHAHRSGAQLNTLHSAISKRDANPSLKNEQASDAKSPAPDKYFGFACFAGHDADHALYVVDPNGKMLRLQTNYIPCGVAVDQKHRLAYVSDASNGNVIIYDLVSQKPIKSIKVDGCPCGLALDLRHSRMYVADQKRGCLAVIDTDTMTTIDHVGVGLLPRNATITPDGNFVYVTNQYGNSVSVVDTASLRSIKTIPMGKMPLGIAMDPDGKHVYVANSESNYVSIINTENNSETARVELGTQAGKLLVDAKANLVYVSTVNEKSGQGSIITFGRDNFETISRIPTGPGADDMRLDRTKQRLYVQGFFDNSVYVVDLKKNRTTMWFKNRFTQPKTKVKEEHHH